MAWSINTDNEIIRTGYAIVRPNGKLCCHNAQFPIYYLRRVAKRDLEVIHDGDGRIVRVAIVITK